MHSLTWREIQRFYNEAKRIEPEIEGLSLETAGYWIVQRGLTPEQAAREMLQPQRKASA